MKKYIVIIFFSLFGSAGVAQHAVPSAKDVLDAAYKQATADHKNILLIFHASWCGWCHKMDSSLNNRACKKLFDDNYVIIHLTVFESPRKKAEENKGAAELLKQYKAFDTGIPFWVVLDKDGNLLKDSFIKKADGSSAIIGCPASEKEVAAFIEVLKATSSIKEKELAVITEVFRKNDAR